MNPVALHLSFLLTTHAPIEVDPNTVTPGVVGFFAIALVAVATVLLGTDMVRRIRRTTYREEIRARLAAEVAERDANKPE
ncbi:hypothetical protein [Cryobacterium psychrophilum]|uniref:Uncharacterized protein n=1 Tax=Cryobacterium psychrophilum TaxID=41988 RepID=A0A4Y8KKM8_9MICO|nr:hypothetical protein [Cryobacterium psychrophilum]TDW30825.1 hypothetical protein EDD25_2602 [Cryobacterium psychrophilum]TFD75782.1 hypothetical protein E3T53_15000 [Cryobacterium psychrophilum]